MRHVGWTLGFVLLAATAGCGDKEAANGTESAGAGGAAGAGPGASASSAAAGGAGGGDELAPWEGGSTYYGQWPNGPPSDASFFPITVWLQNPDRALDYAAIGVNTFIGLWQGPTDAQLATLTAAGMPVACDQNSVGLAHATDPIILAWTHQDEPDNAQPNMSGGYDPCVPMQTIIDLYNDMKQNDPTRPVFLNFGQGVAYEDWIGRGDCTGHLEHYPEYIKGADIISFDIYPANEPDPPVASNLWYVARGIDRLREYAEYKKPVWNWIEASGIQDPSGKPTPEELKAEVWMSIVHGSLGIGYFVHQFAPSFNEHALLDDPVLKPAVTAINQQIRDLAPVLNTPPLANAVSVTSSDANVPVDVLVKRYSGALYVFAVAMRGSPVTATISVKTTPAGQAEALGEGRMITLASGAFDDSFDGWGVHIYRITD